MRVLGIETSCDETALALYAHDGGLLGHVIHSQIELHCVYGGVVPELAARDHIRKLTPLLQHLLQQTQTSLHQLDGIAYTAGPGLVGALLTGAAFARSLAWALQLPAVGVHHLEGHLLAAQLEADPPMFPFITLLVSGGHTQLVQVRGVGQYQLLGESLDDAAGEAFDKTAKLLGLGYPGGPQLAKLAALGQPSTWHFPRPLLRQGLDFSFSGLKTAVLHAVQTPGLSATDHANIAWAFQEALTDVLTQKCLRALRQTGLTRLVVAGGVGANQRLRQRLHETLTPQQVQVYFPRPEFCTDNAAMIAYAGYLRLQAGERECLGEFGVRARWPLTELAAIA